MNLELSLEIDAMILLKSKSAPHRLPIPAQRNAPGLHGGQRRKHQRIEQNIRHGSKGSARSPVGLKRIHDPMTVPKAMRNLRLPRKMPSNRKMLRQRSGACRTPLPDHRPRFPNCDTTDASLGRCRSLHPFRFPPDARYKWHVVIEIGEADETLGGCTRMVTFDLLGQARSYGLEGNCVGLGLLIAALSANRAPTVGYARTSIGGVSWTPRGSSLVVYRATPTMPASCGWTE